MYLDSRLNLTVIYFNQSEIKAKRNLFMEIKIDSGDNLAVNFRTVLTLGKTIFTIIDPDGIILLSRFNTVNFHLRKNYCQIKSTVKIHPGTLYLLSIRSKRAIIIKSSKIPICWSNIFRHVNVLKIRSLFLWSFFQTVQIDFL